MATSPRPEPYRAPKGAWDLLGVTPEASEEDIRSHYRRAARACHPDHSGPESTARFQELTAAYNAIKRERAERLNQARTANEPDADAPAAAPSWAEAMAKETAGAAIGTAAAHVRAAVRQQANGRGPVAAAGARFIDEVLGIVAEQARTHLGRR